MAKPLEERWEKEFEDGAFRLWNNKQKKLMLHFISTLLAQEREKIVEGWKEPNRQAYERGRQEERAKVRKYLRSKAEISNIGMAVSVLHLDDLLTDLQVKE